MKYSLTVEIDTPTKKRSVLIQGGKCCRCKKFIPLVEAFDHACPEQIIAKGKRKIGGAK